MSITNTEGDSQVHKKGDIVAIEKEPLLFSSKNHVPVLMYPLDEGVFEAKVSLPTYRSWHGEQFKNIINEKVESVTDTILIVQRLLTNNAPQEALEKVTPLAEAHPHKAILLLKVNCLVLLARHDQAIKTLNSLLNQYPDNPEAKTMLTQLTGKRGTP